MDSFTVVTRRGNLASSRSARSKAAFCSGVKQCCSEYSSCASYASPLPKARAASAAAGSLEEQSKTLASAVAAFRLEQQAPAAPEAKAPEAKPQAHLEPAKPLAARKPAAKKPQAHHPLPKKGNGHLEEGWQEF